jgi:hypothetical protein
VRGRLHEIALAKPAQRYELEDVALDGGACDFEEIQGEGVTTGIVGVPESEPGVEPHRQKREAAFDFRQAVAVGEKCVDGLGGALVALSRAQDGAATIESSPMRRHPGRVLTHEPDDVDAGPRAEISGGGLGFQDAKLLGTLGRPDPISESVDHVARPLMTEHVSGDSGLAGHLGGQEIPCDRNANVRGCRLDLRSPESGVVKAVADRRHGGCAVPTEHDDRDTQVSA